MSSTVSDRIDGLSTSVAIKAPCRVATTAAITASGLQTIDGISLAVGDRVLRKNETTLANNGIWIASTTDWTRALDFNGARDATDGTLVSITDGTVNAGTAWRLDAVNPVTIGTTSLSFSLSQTPGSSSGSNFNTLALALASNALSVGDVVTIKEYTSGKGIINAKYDVVASGTGTADGFEFHNDTITGSTFQLQLRIPDIVNIKLGGVYGDNSQDSDTLINVVTTHTSVKNVFWPAGTYRCDGPITPSNNQTWFGENNFESKIVNTGYDGGLITLNTLARVAIRDLYIEGTNSELNTSERNIYLVDNCESCVIENCYITKAGRNGLTVQQTGAGNQPADITVRNNTFILNRGNAIFFNGVVKGQIKGNYIRDNGGGGDVGFGIIIDLYFGNEPEDNIVSGNNLLDNEEGGIQVLGAQRTVISGNTITDSGGSSFSGAWDNCGICMRYKVIDATTYYPTGTIISGNTIARSYDHGIMCDGVLQTVISDNNISDSGYNWAATTDSAGIHVTRVGAQLATNLVIDGNMIRSSDALSYAEYGIYTIGTQISTISNNVVWEGGDTAQIRVAGDSSYDALAANITGNTIYGRAAETATIDITYLDYGLVDSNTIYNAGSYGIQLDANTTNVTIGEKNVIHSAATADYNIANPDNNKWIYENPGSGVYDFAVDGGAVGSKIIGHIPDNATITRAWYEVLTAPTSGGSATIGLGVQTDDATGILAATAYNNAIFNTGYHDAVPDGTAANFTTKSTAYRPVNFVIGAADLTAGKVKVWWEYVISQ